VERIPLLCGEGWRDSLIEAGAPGAKRKRDSAQPQEKGEASINGQFGETLRQSDHYYGFALSRSRFAPGCAASVASWLLLIAQPPLLCEEGNITQP